MKRLLHIKIDSFGDVEAISPSMIVKVILETNQFLKILIYQYLYYISLHFIVSLKIIYSIDKTLIECNNNKNLFENYTISKPSIIKIYNILRNKIKIEMHKNWKNKLLGESITEKGFAAIEIDESEIIGNSEIIYWMFGLIDRVTKEARIFCVLNDRTKNNLLPLVKNNVLSNDMNEFEDDENMEIDEKYQNNTRIYSD